MKEDEKFIMIIVLPQPPSNMYNRSMFHRLNFLFRGSDELQTWYPYLKAAYMHLRTVGNHFRLSGKLDKPRILMYESRQVMEALRLHSPATHVSVQPPSQVKTRGHVPHPSSFQKSWTIRVFNLPHLSIIKLIARRICNVWLVFALPMPFVDTGSLQFKAHNSANTPEPLEFSFFHVNACHPTQIPRAKPIRPVQYIQTHQSTPRRPLLGQL